MVESSAGSVGLLLLEVESAWCDDGDSSWTAGTVDSAAKRKINLMSYIFHMKCLYLFFSHPHDNVSHQKLNSIISKNKKKKIKKANLVLC